MHCPGWRDDDGVQGACGFEHDTYVIKGDGVSAKPKAIASAAGQAHTHRYVRWNDKPGLKKKTEGREDSGGDGMPPPDHRQLGQ